MNGRKVTICLSIAGNDGCHTYGGGDSPGPGGPQTALAFHEMETNPLIPA
ncbi:MAG: hypothetical protein HXS54_04350 [Theionarchaea archaeon]|nr:hypothetical protein [Theionarchaea archaeon]